MRDFYLKFQHKLRIILEIIKFKKIVFLDRWKITIRESHLYRIHFIRILRIRHDHDFLTQIQCVSISVTAAYIMRRWISEKTWQNGTIFSSLNFKRLIIAAHEINWPWRVQKSRDQVSPSFNVLPPLKW